MEKSLTAAILAGGKGKRMAVANKAGLLVDGEKIITGIINTLSDLFQEIIIITNTPEDFPEFNKYRMEGDLYSGRGPLGGVHSALKNTDSDAVFVFAGDMPFLDKGLILRQINEFNSGSFEILVPGTGSSIEPLHAIYSRKILDRLEDYIRSGESNAIRDLFSRVGTGYFDPGDNFNTRRAFTNINTPADLIEAERIKREGRQMGKNSF